MSSNSEALARLRALNDALLKMLQQATTLDDKLRLHRSMMATSQEINSLLVMDAQALADGYTPGDGIKEAMIDLKRLQNEVHVIISDIAMAAAVLSAITQAITFLAPLIA